MSTMTRPATIRLLAAVASLLLVSALIVRTTDAAFTATTQNTGNSFAAGSVSIIDYDGDVAMFDVAADGSTFSVNTAGLVPGRTETNCLRVEYTGDVDATVAFGVSTVTGNLPQYLNVVVTEYDGAGCSGTSAQVADDTLANLAGTSQPTTWAPTTTEDRWFEVSVSVADDDDAQGKSAIGVGFTWTASS